MSEGVRLRFSKAVRAFTREKKDFYSLIQRFGKKMRSSSFST
jgi:hypothetical protein